MNVYDTVNKLATEIKESEEYKNFKSAKQIINEDNFGESTLKIEKF